MPFELQRKDSWLLSRRNLHQHPHKHSARSVIPGGLRNTVLGRREVALRLVLNCSARVPFSKGRAKFPFRSFLFLFCFLSFFVCLVNIIFLCL